MTDADVRPGTGPGPEARRPRRPRRLAARVLIVQLITLVALWLLQATYGS